MIIVYLERFHQKPLDYNTSYCHETVALIKNSYFDWPAAHQCHLYACCGLFYDIQKLKVLAKPHCSLNGKVDLTLHTEGFHCQKGPWEIDWAFGGTAPYAFMIAIGWILMKFDTRINVPLRLKCNNSADSPVRLCMLSSLI